MAVDWTAWEPRERAVLSFLEDGDRLLLILKKRGLGTGKVNAPGGRVEPGETWEQAAVRETREETGILVHSVRPVAELRFQFMDGYALQARVFLARGWEGTLAACDEADPFWQSRSDLPWNRMWADDALWLPPVLAGRLVDARFLFEGESMREAEVLVHDRPQDPING